MRTILTIIAAFAVLIAAYLAGATVVRNGYADGLEAGYDIGYEAGLTIGEAVGGG